MEVNYGKNGLGLYVEEDIVTYSALEREKNKALTEFHLLFFFNLSQPLNILQLYILL